MSQQQINYISSYNKENYKMYPFRVKKSNIALISKLDNVYSRNAYITKLIENDINPSVLTIKQIKQIIKPIMEKHGIKDVFLFGSYSRGEANKDSDVDIYCDSGDIKTLYDEVRFTDELKVALNKEVDVVTIGSEMHEYFRKQLEEDLIKLW